MLSVGEQLMAERKRLLSYALRLTHNYADAEDLVSDTLVNAYRKWDSFDGQNLHAWLRRILFNRFVTVYRKRVPIPVGDTRDIEPASAPSAEDAAFRDTLSPEVAAAFRRLTPEHRELLYLVDVQDASVTDLARADDVPPRLYQVRLHRARHRMRALLEEAA